MKNTVLSTIKAFYENNILEYLQSLYNQPLRLVILVLDIAIVLYLAFKFIQVAKGSRAWQLLKGIVLFIFATVLSGILGLRVLNFILTSILDIGVIALIVIFQPELRRALEQLGTNKITKFFGLTEDLETKTREDVYKIILSALEMSSGRIGGLIVIERDIKIKDIIDSGVPISADVSPQIIVNIFTPKTPLHDGAIIISNNKIAAAACMLPLANDSRIAQELGMRHRAAIGMATESDAVVVVISEETGKISIAKDGTLIVDVKEEALRKILIKNIVIKKFGDTNNRQSRFNKIKESFMTGKKKTKIIKAENLKEENGGEEKKKINKNEEVI